MAGAPGFEPGLSVLETDVLAVDTMPLRPLFSHSLLFLNCIRNLQKRTLYERAVFLLFNFFMSNMLPTEATILLPFKSIRIVFLVLHRRVISPLTFPTSQGNNDSHCSHLVFVIFFTPRPQSRRQPRPYGPLHAPQTAAPAPSQSARLTLP